MVWRERNIHSVLLSSSLLQDQVKSSHVRSSHVRSSQSKKARVSKEIGLARSLDRYIDTGLNHSFQGEGGEDKEGFQQGIRIVFQRIDGG